MTPQTPRSANSSPAPIRRLPIVDPLMFVHATAHNDLEQMRIASEHRLWILTATEPDEDGVMRGFGLSETQPDVARLRGIADALRALENDAKLGMCRSLRKSPLYPWIKGQIGLGDKQVARLLSAIGDPFWHLAEDRPRTVSELWAYSGLHVLPGSAGTKTSDPDHCRSDDPMDLHGCSVGVAAKRKKGVKSNWSADAKVRAYLCATSCIKKTESPYRTVYLERRARTALTHPDWTPGHSHNDALRIASKAILRDLWRESKRIHEQKADEATCRRA